MEIDLDAEIVRQDDGTLVVVVVPPRGEETEEGVAPAGETVVLHPGEGGYDDALAAWDLQHHPDRPEAVSTASGREQAMEVVHTLGGDPDADAEQVLARIDDRESAAEALRHVLVGGDPSVAAFAQEIAEAHGGEPLPTHTVTRTIGTVLSALEA